MKYIIDGNEINNIELKCLVVSRGLKIEREVYSRFSHKYRLDKNALTCNCFKLPDDTIVMATDLGMHLSTLSSMFSWENLKLFKYMNDMKTDFLLTLDGDEVVLKYKKETITPVRFMPYTDFYKQKTSSGMSFAGNSVLQGCDWVAFQCLWPCEYAMAGKSCQYCFSGGQYEALAKKDKPMPFIPSPTDVAEVINYAIDNSGSNSVQITGGSTFESKVEEKYITEYMKAIGKQVGLNRLTGEILLYITPPKNKDVIDRYFAMGASRIACSIEVWDDNLAMEIMPGKSEYTTKQRHLDALEHIADKFGPNKAFSNFVIGLEPIETLREGAQYIAERGIIPSASIWMPFGKPVRGSMKPPELDYYRRVIDIFGNLYAKYDLRPAGECGLNVCIERDIWRGNQLL